MIGKIQHGFAKGKLCPTVPVASEVKWLGLWLREVDFVCFAFSQAFGAVSTGIPETKQEIQTGWWDVWRAVETGDMWCTECAELDSS